MGRRRAGAIGLLTVLIVVPMIVGAHGAGIRGSRQAISVPTWLFLATGGAIVGASFLLTSLVTERAFVRAIHTANRKLPGPPPSLRATGAGIGFAGVTLIVVGGLLGPADALRNAAILLVWVVWWPGVTMATYLVGNAWPAINPARTLARVIGYGERRYPERWGAWPATVGVLTVIFLEVVTPVASSPSVLVTVVVGYLVASTAGGLVFGIDWYRYGDPISRAFRVYGHMAPIQRRDDDLRVVPPGAGLIDDAETVPGTAPFVVALLWGTTYDGLIGTPLFVEGLTWVVRTGLPPLLAYFGALVAGYAIFLGVYRGAMELARPLGPTYHDPGWLAARFGSSLIPIAAGYHFAHYVGDIISLAPALGGLVIAPLDPPTAAQLPLPGWFGVVPVGAVLAGHLIAIAAAHAIAFEIFPGRLQAIRAQLPLTATMIGYTIVSLWIVTRATQIPPFI